MENFVYRTKDTCTNLCDFCALCIAECPSLNIRFGDGVGGDNVVQCTSYQPATTDISLSVTLHEQKCEELLQLVREIQKYQPGLVLTGSLMLYVRQIKPRRQPADIDFTGEFDVDTALTLPDTYNTTDHVETSDGAHMAIIHTPTGTKIDCLNLNDEPEDGIELINGVLCASVSWMLSIKLWYAEHDRMPVTGEKHLDDLQLLMPHMTQSQLYKYEKLQKNRGSGCPLSKPS